jgi:indolepyruvate ferredoxin oxidoreductase, beta subunit
MTATGNMDLLITGVGGQGVVLASDILGETAIMAGLDVKKTDTLGMAQRGGAVVSHVRIGEKVWSPIIRDGNVDLILAFEELEAARWVHYLKPGGIVIVNDYVQPPLSVSLGTDTYPSRETVESILKTRTEQVYFIDANARAAETGNIRTANILMLGCLSVFAPLEKDTWIKSIRERMPAKLVDINLAAFELGRKEIEGVRIR